jgi:hypothetical protein
MQHTELRRRVRELREELIFEYEDKLRRTKFLTGEEEEVYNKLKNFCDKVITWMNTPDTVAKEKALERKKHNERYYKRPENSGVGGH